MKHHHYVHVCGTIVSLSELLYDRYIITTLFFHMFIAPFVLPPPPPPPLPRPRPRLPALPVPRSPVFPFPGAEGGNQLEEWGVGGMGG